MDNDQGVQFNNEHDNDFDNVKITSAYEKKATLADFLVKYSGGSIKNKDQANYVLVVVAVVLFIIALYVFAGDSQPVQDIPFEIYYLDQ